MENQGLRSHNPGAIVVHYSEGSLVVRKKCFSKQSSFSSCLRGDDFLRDAQGGEGKGLGSPGSMDLDDQLNEPQ